MKSYTKIAFMLAIIAVLLIPRNSAIAAPALLCSGSGCNYVDPVTSGCASSSGVFTAIAKWKTAASGTVRMDLRYAPVCNSNWTRVTNESPSAVRKLRAELWNSSMTTLITSYDSSIYVYIWTVMYDGSTVLCGRGKQGPVGGSFDATTAFGCA
jgi:hypothetical protein